MQNANRKIKKFSHQIRFIGKDTEENIEVNSIKMLTEKDVFYFSNFTQPRFGLNDH